MERRKLLTPADVEEVYQITQRMQARLRATRRLPYVKLSEGRGGRIRYDVADIEQYLAAVRHEAQPI